MAASKVEEVKQKIHHAVDLKDAVERHERFEDLNSGKHIVREQLYEVKAPAGLNELDSTFTDEHPSAERLRKLLDTRDAMQRAGLKIAPEEEVWRTEVDEVLH